jgi:hypothetical protein
VRSVELEHGAIFCSRSRGHRGARPDEDLRRGLHDLAGWLDPLRFLSPFWLIGSSPLQDGVDGWGVLVVLAGALAAVAVGAVLVERRDLEVS